MPNFSIPLSGLDASSAALATTANNLANLNTVGYKDQKIQFADLFFDPLSTNPTTQTNYFTAPFTATGQVNTFPSRPPPRGIRRPSVPPSRRVSSGTKR